MDGRTVRRDLIPSRLNEMSPALDDNALPALLGRDPVRLCRVYRLYLDTCAKSMAKMEAVVSRGELVAIKASAHTLKSSSYMVGAIVLGDLCASMEDAADCGDVKRMEALLPSLLESADAALEWVRQQIGRIEESS